MTAPIRPTGFAKAGRTMWDAIVGKWTFRPDELRILEDACREADLIDDLQKHLRGAERIVRGSQGQPVINPLIPELRQHRATLAQLVGKLQLPDEAGATPRSVGARRAAQARWNTV